MIWTWKALTLAIRLLNPSLCTSQDKSNIFCKTTKRDWHSSTVLGQKRKKKQQDTETIASPILLTQIHVLLCLWKLELRVSKDTVATNYISNATEDSFSVPSPLNKPHQPSANNTSSKLSSHNPKLMLARKHLRALSLFLSPPPFFIWWKSSPEKFLRFQVN